MVNVQWAKDNMVNGQQSRIPGADQSKSLVLGTRHQALFSDKRMTVSCNGQLSNPYLRKAAHKPHVCQWLMVTGQELWV